MVKKKIAKKRKKRVIQSKSSVPATQVIGRGPKGTFLPGFSGNPKGPGKLVNTYTNRLRELMEAKEIKIDMTLAGQKKIINLKSKSDIHTLVASRQIMAAINGDSRAAKEIIDRIQGKSIATVQGSIQVNHVILDAAATMLSEVLLEEISDPELIQRISDKLSEKMGKFNTDQLNEV